MGKLTFSYSGFFFFFNYSHGFKLAGLPCLLLPWINENQLPEPQWAVATQTRVCPTSTWAPWPPSLCPFTDPPRGTTHVTLETEMILSKVTVTLAIVVRATVLCMWNEAWISPKWWPWGDVNWTNTKLVIKNMSDISFYSRDILKPSSLF